MNPKHRMAFNVQDIRRALNGESHSPVLGLVCVLAIGVLASVLTSCSSTSTSEDPFYGSRSQLWEDDARWGAFGSRSNRGTESTSGNDRSPASSNGFNVADSVADEVTPTARFNRRLRLGMSRQSVQSLLGQPDQVEPAGNPMYGNERWQYSNESSTERGFQRRTRVIYFEGGRVVGWQTL